MFILIATAEDIKMLSTNSNDYDHIEREKKVLELYRQGKSTRYIAKELRMSLRDISIILIKCQVNHGIVTTKAVGKDLRYLL
jgi:DNA-binding NarL/FixJ family response regulator